MQRSVRFGIFCIIVQVSNEKVSEEIVPAEALKIQAEGGNDNLERRLLRQMTEDQKSMNARVVRITEEAIKIAASIEVHSLLGFCNLRAKFDQNIVDFLF